jgi:hypothetical protein
VKDVVVTNKNFTAKVTQVTPGKAYKVDVTFQPPAKRARDREIGEMIINTNDPREPSVKVHLVARAI